MTSGASKKPRGSKKLRKPKKPRNSGRKTSQPVESPWLDAHRGAIYADEEYRRFLMMLKDGVIRSIRVGRKYKTRTDWIDEYYYSLEDTGMLESVK